jgi:hypothetical protein
MKVVRILLQLILLTVGGVTLAALITNPTPDIGVIAFLGLLAFLFALTLALKEETTARLALNHKPSIKPIGIAMLLLGTFGVFYGASYLFGTEPLPNGSGRCRAICGLLLIASQWLGETAARLIAFGWWSSIGLFLCFAGYKATIAKST